MIPLMNLPLGLSLRHICEVDLRLRLYFFVFVISFETVLIIDFKIMKGLIISFLITLYLHCLGLLIKFPIML